MTPDHRQYISLETAAERLEVHPRTVRRMIARGDLTGFRMGSARLVRIDATELDRLAHPIPTAGGGAA
jgi:excisionase family DNA binding protein